MDGVKRTRKIFVWSDEEGKINVSLAHQSEEELQKEYDWESNERLLCELPFKLEGSEGLGGESPENYYRAIEGLLELSGVEAVMEILLAKMVQEGISLARHLPPPKEILH